jgi:group I intron endonuclease
MAYIYKITNIITEHSYVGKTEKSIQERFRRHISNSKNGNTHLYKAFRKYGIDSFRIEVLEEVLNENIDDRERYHIASINPHYNMTEGGEGGYTSNSPNFIKAMKDYHSRKDKSSYATYGMKGKKFPHESKKLISEKISCPVMCDGIRYESVGKAQEAYPGIAIRKRLDNSKYPNFYRLREITRRK